MVPSSCSAANPLSGRLARLLDARGDAIQTDGCIPSSARSLRRVFLACPHTFLSGLRPLSSAVRGVFVSCLAPLVSLIALQYGTRVLRCVNKVESKNQHLSSSGLRVVRYRNLREKISHGILEVFCLFAVTTGISQIQLTGALLKGSRNGADKHLSA